MLIMKYKSFTLQLKSIDLVLSQDLGLRNDLLISYYCTTD